MFLSNVCIYETCFKQHCRHRAAFISIHSVNKFVHFVFKGDVMNKRKLISIFCIFFMLLQLTGCSSAGKQFDATNNMKIERESYAAFDEEGSVSASTRPDTVFETSTATMNIPNDLKTRKIIKNASLCFETKTYDAFMTALEQCIAGLGGYIESSEIYGGGIYSTCSSRNSYIIARIPEEQYELFMTDVCTIGTLTYKSESSDDVTMNYVDTESHIHALEAEYSALLEILDKATSLDDVIQLQSRITEVTYQLDSYKAQLRKYDDLIDYCTVNIDVIEVWRETPNDERMSFGARITNGLAETFYKIGEDFKDFSVWLITSMPYILIWILLLAVFILLIRRCIKTIKKKKEQKLINQYMNQINENNDSNHL